MGSVQQLQVRCSLQVQVDHQHTLAEQHDAAGSAVIAGIAVLEIVDAVDAQETVAVAANPGPVDGDGIVEQLQPFGIAGGFRRRDGLLARIEAVEPEPRAAAEEQESK